jgi:hypothetical protein
MRYRWELRAYCRMNLQYLQNASESPEAIVCERQLVPRFRERNVMNPPHPQVAVG